MAVLLILILSVTACRGDMERTEDNGYLRVSPKKIDLGEVGSYAPISLRVDLLNTGNEAVRILKVQKSCCCSASITTGTVLPPGEMIPLPIGFQPVPSDSDVKVFRNALHISWESLGNEGAGGLTGTVDVAFHGEVKESVSVTPREVVFFEDSADAPRPQTVRIASLSRTPFKITEVDVPNPISYRMESDGRTDTEHEIHFLLGNQEDRAVGANKIGMAILRTTDPGQAEIHLPVMAVTLSHLVADPAVVVVRDCEPGSPRVFSITVARRDGLPFRLAEVRTRSDWLRSEYASETTATSHVVEMIADIEKGGGKDVIEFLGTSGKREVASVLVYAAACDRNTPGETTGHATAAPRKAGEEGRKEEDVEKQAED
ncbi:DUF1573 domain-containing protein [Candidatus Sumerlaeota bacterium]|nr:DUF1573 domain-containing protein [Candidatus Sumerlaeota bacterium]